MSRRKTLQEQTIKNNFLFAAVMMQGNNCQRLLEIVLGIPIERVEVSYEKSIVYNPQYKGIRLDVFAKDGSNTHYDIEMQVIKRSLEKRSRYYHSQMDMDILLSGKEYEELPGSYVIFICDFDPLGAGRYKYTIENVCKEDHCIKYQDGCHTIFLSTQGTNDDEVSEELVNFLKYVGAELEDSETDFGDHFVEQLQKTIRQIKASREMGERYMLFEELLKEERAEGKVEGKIESILGLLEDIGELPDELRNSIEEEKDISRLENLLRAAAKAETIDEFIIYHRELLTV